MFAREIEARLRPGPALAFLCLALAASCMARAGKADAPTARGGVLDQKRIHYEYNEGNFESVISALEQFMAENASYRHSDSVFIAKHLAVVYSANSATREKGKYYMYRLLELLPSAKLVDMYVSDEIDRIFDKVREEFLVRQRAFGMDTSSIALPAKPDRQAPASAPRSPDRAGSGNPGTSMHPGFWVGGGVLLAAAAATFFLMNEEPDPEDKVLIVRDRDQP